MLFIKIVIHSSKDVYIDKKLPIIEENSFFVTMDGPNTPCIDEFE